MSGSIKNSVHNKHLVNAANSMLDYIGWPMYKNVGKVRDSVQSLARSLSPSKERPSSDTSEDKLISPITNDEHNSQVAKDNAISADGNYVHKAEEALQPPNANGNTSNQIHPRQTDHNQSDPDQSYYTSYILPVVSRLYGTLPNIKYPEKDEQSWPKKLSDIPTNELQHEEKRECEYEQFDVAMREASAAQLVGQVINATKSSESKALADGITMRLKDLTKASDTTSAPKFTNKSAIDTRTRGLCIAFKSAKSSASKLIRLEELCLHLRQYPESRNAACKQNISNHVMKTGIESKDKTMKSVCNEILAHLGCVLPVKRKGVNILSIDGGGSRAVISIELLRELERQSGQRIPDLFDYVIGTSTGALVAVLLSVFRVSLDDCEQLYKELSQLVFAKSLWGTGRLVWSHAYYDSDVLEKLYRSNMGEKHVIESSRDQRCPKLGIVSTAVNQSRLSAYLFRNYNLPQRVQSHYQGTSEYKLWQCLMASCAAPGYFEEYKLGQIILQDGGMLTNNPTAVGLHEAMLLWPGEQIQCIVSLGNGRYEHVTGTETDGEPQSISLKSKLTKIVDSATDTEKVHTLLHDLLPPNTYYRLNPYMSEDIMLDEQRTDKLEQLQNDARMYIRRNEYKFHLLSQQLLQRKPKYTELLDKIALAFNTRWL